MFEIPYLIEILTPRYTDEGYSEGLLTRFGERLDRIMQAGCGVSIPDNPMGNLRMGALDAIASQKLGIDPQRVVVNLNTFHHKEELDQILAKAAAAGIRFLLVVRGDGGPELSRLEPASIGGRFNVATSAELISYINRAWSGTFVTGAAFNHYNPIEVELQRLEKKIAAGAGFIVSQPVVGNDARISRLHAYGIPVVVEAWMSHNIELFARSVGDDSLEISDYDPYANLNLLHRSFPGSCMYLSMLNFDEQFELLLPALST